MPSTRMPDLSVHATAVEWLVASAEPKIRLQARRDLMSVAFIVHRVIAAIVGADRARRRDGLNEGTLRVLRAGGAYRLVAGF